MKARIRSVPKEPSQEERDTHAVSHAPFRSWCKHCVRVRAVSNPNQRDTRDCDELMIIIDYMWMVNEPIESTSPMEVTESDRKQCRKWWKTVESGSPILVMKDRHHNTYKAVVVPAQRR